MNLFDLDCFYHSHFGSSHEMVQESTQWSYSVGPLDETWVSAVFEIAPHIVPGPARRITLCFMSAVVHCLWGHFAVFRTAHLRREPGF